MAPFYQSTEIADTVTDKEILVYKNKSNHVFFYMCYIYNVYITITLSIFRSVLLRKSPTKTNKIKNDSCCKEST